MLKTEYLVAKFGFDTAENEPLKVHLIIQHWDSIFTEPPRPGPGRRTALRSSSTPRARRWPSPPQQRSPSRLARPTFMLSIFLTFGEFLASFERPVLGCIEADFCK